MATPPSPPPPSDNIKYFWQHPQNTWDLIEYLEWCRKLGDYEHDIALSRWVRSLESIANDPAESEDRRAKAQILREKYKRRSVCIFLPTIPPLPALGTQARLLAVLSAQVVCL
ncbi:hypothetical protein P167DRAFT_539781 [Morchella conica CCBAS932]|uniref:Uncharacterized protein n=1 Tax=Morchella conica CCBAS932 TaxID=1392247 RepID=A0A3N4KEM3_9PEZI|nr:hypothetical protein P167DRAFT_539781 [Morchella conica CCBAS932]